MPVDEKTEAVTPSSSSKKRKAEAANGLAIGKGSASKCGSRNAGEIYAGVGKAGEGARGRLWVCDVSLHRLSESRANVQLCFKYMQTRDGWTRHVVSDDSWNPSHLSS
jgi:histone acetyltransferase HTATIP